MNMEGVFLCSEYLQSHPLYELFGSDLANLAERDYPGQGIFKGCEIPSIDLDAFERSSDRSNDCTSDGVIGIADVSVCRFSSRRLLLTELRMGYETPKNLDFHNIRQKYIHSSDILHESDPVKTISSEFALIFKRNVAPIAQRKFWSWAKESSKRSAVNWKAYDPESFCNYISYGKTLPLMPTEETVAFVASFCAESHIAYDQLSNLKDKIVNYWWRIKGRNLSVDMEYLSARLSSFLSSVSFPIGEEGELCELLKEDIEEIISRK